MKYIFIGMALSLIVGFGMQLIQAWCLEIAHAWKKRHHSRDEDWIYRL